jgi:hypothetical protein
MKTATYIKNLTGFAGTAALYKLSSPLEGHNYVVVSSVTRPIDPETYIFPADKRGDILDWSELRGSQHGTLNHADALKSAGYDVIKP